MRSATSPRHRTFLAPTTRRHARMTPTPRTWRALMATVATITLLLGAVVAQAQASDETSAGFESSWPAPESCMSLVSTATVTTDQDDYAPGSTVVVSGSGFGAGCDYELHVVRPDDVVEKLSVTSDADGTFSAEHQLPPPPGVIGEYRIDVVGLGDQVLASVAFMDAIAFANTGTAMTTSGGQHTLNLPKPTSTASGDFLIAQVSAGGTDSSKHICAPSGWTSIRRTTQGSDVAIHTFYRFAAAPDASVSTYQFTVRGASNCTGSTQQTRMSGGIIRYTGVDTTMPVEAHSGNVGSSSNTLTALTVNASAGARVIGFYGLKKNTGLTPHASDGMTERFDVFVNDGSGPASMAADLEKSTAGATGNKRATTGVAEVWAAQLVSLKAAPSGPTKLAFTTPSRSGTVGECLGPITVQTQNAGGAPTNVTGTTPVGLASDGNGAFYADDDCSNSITAATVAAGGNSATFYYTATARGTGAHALTASATGMTAATQIQTIDKLGQTITFEALPDGTYGDPELDPGATADSGLPVGYSSSTPGVCTITVDDTVRIVGTGACTVTASQAGDADYHAADDVTRSFSVAPKGLTGSFAAEDKVYDGTTAATIDGHSLSGAIAGDDVELSGGTATFEDKHVGVGKTVSATGFTLAGADKNNYALAAGPWTAQGDVTPRSVTGSFTAADKVYDGTTDATITGRSLAGAIAGDSIELSDHDGEHPLRHRPVPRDSGPHHPAAHRRRGHERVQGRVDGACEVQGLRRERELHRYARRGERLPSDRSEGRNARARSQRAGSVDHAAHRLPVVGDRRTVDLQPQHEGAELRQDVHVPDLAGGRHEHRPQVRLEVGPWFSVESCSLGRGDDAGA